MEGVILGENSSGEQQKHLRHFSGRGGGERRINKSWREQNGWQVLSVLYSCHGHQENWLARACTRAQTHTLRQTNRHAGHRKKDAAASISGPSPRSQVPPSSATSKQRNVFWTRQSAAGVDTHAAPKVLGWQQGSDYDSVCAHTERGDMEVNVPSWLDSSRPDGWRLKASFSWRRKCERL